MSDLNKRMNLIKRKFWKGDFEVKYISLYKVKFSLGMQGYTEKEIEEIVKVILACETIKEGDLK